ncbi:nanos homolog 3 [Spea bombifrons]|uniref:nanos homolog 3 n=1 Tax=Spea bombifrons TaxID=233779 RepID=UPI002348F06E|nr:nanos homolog 3 [Spea bombifrons]
MEPFDMWKDYLGLNKVVKELEASLTRTATDRSTERTAAPEMLSGSHEATIPGPPHDVFAPPTQSTPAPREGEASLCSFCKHNGESRAIYTQHNLKDAAGKIQCPILRSYICPQCGATGDNAHTRRFCPLTGKSYTSVYQSSRNAAGKRMKKDR